MTGSTATDDPPISVRPGPRGLALVHTALDYHRHGLSALERMVARYGDVVRVELPGIRAFLFGHPELIQHVLVRQRDRYLKINGGRNVQRFFGNAMQLNNGDYARHLRRTLAHAFQPDRIAAVHTAPIVRATEALIDRWAPGPRPSLTAELMDLALDITVELHLGAAPGEDTRQLGRLFTAAIGSLRDFMLPEWAPTPHNRRYHAAVAALDAAVMSRIAARRRDGATGGDLMASFLAMEDDHGQPLSDRQIRDELITMMAAGYQSVGIAINQTLRLVAEHPEVDRQLAAELATVLGDRLPGADDLARLSYGQKVVKEALRSCPPAGVLARRAAVDDVVAGVQIPAGARVFLSAWAMHRDPRYYVEPAAFRPERWTSELERSLPMCAYFPYGRGARACIAGSLSSFIIQLVVTLVVRRYRLEALRPTSPDRSSWPSILAAGGLGVTLAPRGRMPTEA
ncbi:MAG TPA: cytochrome P450 [Kofleriaceae bacterium]